MQQETYTALRAVQVLLEEELAHSASLTRAMLGELIAHPGTDHDPVPFADPLAAAAWLRELRGGRVRSVA
jgi:hypothetical protein